MFGNNPTLRFPGNLAQVSNITELRGVSPYEMNDEAAILVTAAGLFTFDASSTENDDGVSVIRPNGFTPLQSGRWVQPGPRTPEVPTTGNTFATLAALQASGLDVAYLVGDPNEPDGTFFKVGSVLTRQKSGSVTFGAKNYGAKGNLSQDDQPPIQSHFDVEGPYASNRGGTALLPRGRYRLGQPILLKSYSEFRGEGPRTSILDQEDAPVNYPAFKWDYSGIQYGFASTSDVGVRGFSHGVLITQDTDEVNLRRMHIYGCTSAGVQVSGMLQTGVFEELKVESCNNGFISSSTICNAMEFRKCDTKNISGEHFHFNGAEGTSVVNWRGEGGGVVGGYTLNISGAKQLTFEGGASYMESTHEYAARIVGTTGVVAFKNFHFTGTGARVEGGAGPYKWLTDGTGDLIFEDCDSTFPMRVPAHSKIIGACPGIIRSTNKDKYGRKPRTVTGSTNFALARFTRLTAAADAGNITTLSGTMRLVVNYVDGGGAYTRLDREIKVSVVGQGATLAINAVTKDTDDTGVNVSTTNLAGTADAGGLSGLLTINLSPLVIGSPVFVASWDIEWSQSASIDQNTFAVELQ